MNQKTKWARVLFEGENLGGWNKGIYRISIVHKNLEKYLKERRIRSTGLYYIYHTKTRCNFFK